MRTEALSSVPAAATSTRVASIDLLRGLIMIVMALDHVRDYFSPFPWDPTDLSKASAALFASSSASTCAASTDTTSESSEAIRRTTHR